MAKWFKIELNVTILKVYAALSTPDWSAENPSYRPGLLPKWEFVDWQEIGLRTEARYMFTLNWFFRLSLAWGGETNTGPDLDAEDNDFQEDLEGLLCPLATGEGKVRCPDCSGKGTLGSDLGIHGKCPVCNGTALAPTTVIPAP